MNVTSQIWSYSLEYFNIQKLITNQNYFCSFMTTYKQKPIV